LKLRTRFWLETVLAAATALLAVLTALWQDWIEIVFGVDPDRHSGSVEVLIVCALAAATAVLAIAARYEWKRAALPAK
jgi:hypothetical protein